MTVQPTSFENESSPLERGAPSGHGIRHALVCLNRSPAGESCLPYAHMVAEAFHAKLTLTHVLRSRDANGGERQRTDALEWAIRRREAEDYLRDVQSTMQRRVTPEIAIAVTQGAPAERIVATAHELGADLTIVANQGVGAARGAVLGTTVQRLLTLATGSVLLARPGSVAPPERIMVLLDGSARTESVLPAVASLAHAYGAAVALVHVVRDPMPTAVLCEPDDVSLSHALALRLETNAKRYLDQLRERALRDVAVTQTLVMRRADSRLALLEAAAQWRADLIVLTAHGSTCNTELPFGSVASYLLARARTSLLVLQDLTGANDDVGGPDVQRISSGPPRTEGN